MRRYCFLFTALLPTLLFAQIPEISLSKGLIINESCKVATDDYTIIPSAETEGCITISGENLVIDFQNAEMRGAAKGVLPHLFSGRAIVVKGKNITLKNARARGYKIALFAEGVEGLTLENCDFSYNYRPRLRSIREREDFSDWLSYHHNEKDEWLRYGAGIYLKNCPRATVKACRITGCQNALLMTVCNDALVYNNFFTFNSGLGIGLYRSSRNKLMHNRLDWNVRGYSHGFYQRGQDSAGILLYEQSSQNTIAYNSATHCGDGLFLWAGQSTMDTGEGGCNDNLIIGNDFSYAPTNGVEVTFSRNRIQGNKIIECTYGIWGGYSYESSFTGNFIADCKTGIAIEHGQNDTIQRNAFQFDSTGIQLWARETQPTDWGYAQKRDTRSRDAVLDRNIFLDTRKPLKISNSKNISVNGENLFLSFDRLLESAKPNESLKFIRNDIYNTEAKIAEVWAIPELMPSKNLNFSHPGKSPENPYAALDIPLHELKEPDSLADGMLAVLPRGFPRGRKFILMDEWGPFDFRRPIASIDTIAGNLYSLVLIGPSGNWKIARMDGVNSVSAKRGTVPATITVERDPASDAVFIEFEYTSPQVVKTVFGEVVPTGKVYKFDFQRFEKKLEWRVKFFNFSPSDSLTSSETINWSTPVAEKKMNDLYFAWWGSPMEGVNEDLFATRSETEFTIAPGDYILEITSDDGVRFYLDDKLLIENWDIHEPETDEITVKLGGSHRIRIEHFDAGGFATLDFRMRLQR
ncbi:MAG: right-handed parallel beta-helix repeat-containing protein [Saprospiraceae bacterium]|nr:right-handed parallel beta-helix repeat-containing protein [Saprospiraceae bacterium]